MVDTLDEAVIVSVDSACNGTCVTSLTSSLLSAPHNCSNVRFLEHIAILTALCPSAAKEDAAVTAIQSLPGVKGVQSDRPARPLGPPTAGRATHKVGGQTRGRSRQLRGA
jgi:hypothetical protein